LFPGLAAEGHHAHGAAVEEFDAFDVGSADQAAIKRVGPAVILATQDIFAAAAESDGPSAMTANVAEGAQCTFLIANDDDWFTSNIGGEKAFRVSDSALRPVYFSAGLAKRADHLPGAPQDARFLNLKDVGIGVKNAKRVFGRTRFVGGRRGEEVWFAFVES